MTHSFYGIFVAIATPFQKDKVDEDALRSHLLYLAQSGISGVVPCGTTGESIALSLRERQRIIEICLEVCGGTLKVIPGTGAPTLREALIYTQQAQELGAHGVLVVSPYYVKADYEGVSSYYRMLHDATHLPMIMYSNPGRTGWEIPTSLIERLANTCPRICGLKDASTDLTRPLALSSVLPASFSLLSGEDATFGAFLAQGGQGLISVGANIVPHLYVALQKAFEHREQGEFMTLNQKLFKLSSLLFQSPSPGPVKHALSLMGYGAYETRLPLAPLLETHRNALSELLTSWGCFS